MAKEIQILAYLYIKQKIMNTNRRIIWHNKNWWQLERDLLKQTYK